MIKDADLAEVERQLAVMRAGSVDFYGERELREKLLLSLRESRPLRVKLGLDPSAPDIHLGHVVVLSKLRSFQDLGHRAILLVGDFTALIGDPSGRKKTRPPLSPEEARANAETYVEQAGRVLDVERAEIRSNSEWMGSMGPSDFVRLCSRYTVARLLEREDFHKRYAAGDPIAVHELLYPFVQAYDSVALRADVELGGTDQTFNLLMAREIQRDYGQPPQAVITLPLLVGLDGREKMSKSLGNHIGVTEPPEQMYGKTMSISDELMASWMPLLEVEVGSGEASPLARKQELASALVKRFHGASAAQAAAERFARVVQRGEAPEDVPAHTVSLGDSGSVGLVGVLRDLGLCSSSSEARRLVEQGGVSVNGERITDPAARLAAGEYLLRVGRRRWLRLSIESPPGAR
jgi:tyrosyl-tRNA synthetase